LTRRSEAYQRAPLPVLAAMRSQASCDMGVRVALYLLIVRRGSGASRILSRRIYSKPSLTEQHV